MPTTGYIAYIDEAGDFGLKNVAPVDPQGASEWFCMGGILIRKSNETKINNWLKDVRLSAKNTQSNDLHFRKLSDRQKTIVCQETAKLNIRAFVVLSNKRNMRRYHNPRASKVTSHKHWFYLWLTRLLLERMTEYCAHRNRIDGTPGHRLQLEFSRRKDIKRSSFTDYFSKLWAQQSDPYLAKRTINWDVFNFEDIHFFDHQTRAGLQFADVIASSFFQSVNTVPHGICKPEFAKLLMPRVARGPTNQNYHDEGVAIQPMNLSSAKLTDAQKDIFRFYGFPENRLGRR
ncbi:MAG: DUF3800 domain-containing protein [Alphaproteobacteria bacterium]|nr:DUF3800 domain-containing protein [Alphaproteobacteria bacterium]